MTGAEELTVYALGGRRFVYVGAGRGERLRDHLGARGFPAAVVPAAGYDRLELERYADLAEAQAALDDWVPALVARGRTMTQTKTRQEREKGPHAHARGARRA
jgi:hypothetical protein